MRGREGVRWGSGGPERAGYQEVAAPPPAENRFRSLGYHGLVNMADSISQKRKKRQKKKKPARLVPATAGTSGSGGSSGSNSSDGSQRRLPLVRAPPKAQLLRPRQDPPLPSSALQRSARSSPCPVPSRPAAPSPLCPPRAGGGAGRTTRTARGPDQAVAAWNSANWVGEGKTMLGKEWSVRPYRAFRTAPAGGHARARDSSIPFSLRTRPRADARLQ